MRRLNCRPDEFFIVMNSPDPANIGSIVKVLGRDTKTCGRNFFWKIHAAHMLNYAKGGKHYSRKKRSLADGDLQPIRGYPLGTDIAIGVTEQMGIREGRFQVFEVDKAGTITSSESEPRTNAGAFRPWVYQTAGQLISALQACPPLEFDVEQAVQDYKALSEDRTHMRQEYWCGWIDSDETALAWLTEFIDGWLEQSVDFGNSEFLKCTTSDGYALRYFQRFDVETLDQLGVYLIEGEHPGSSFSGAVLREDMDYANQVAREKGLGLRFQRVW